MSQPRTGGEKQILSAFLDQQRDVVLWKLDGLTDDQLRQPITPGGLYLLGLVKHLAAPSTTGYPKCSGGQPSHRVSPPAMTSNSI
jgi:Protein of unknown function (DUF664)